LAKGDAVGQTIFIDVLLDSLPRNPETKNRVIRSDLFSTGRQ